ncbi:unnamed protein product [Ectocarpus sp. 8 AP-2014]
MNQEACKNNVGQQHLYRERRTSACQAWQVDDKLSKSSTNYWSLPRWGIQAFRTPLGSPGVFIVGYTADSTQAAPKLGGARRHLRIKVFCVHSIEPNVSLQTILPPTD